MEPAPSDSPIEFPFAADGAAKKTRVGACGLAVHLIIGAHHTRNIPLNHTCFERNIVCVLQILFAHLQFG